MGIEDKPCSLSGVWSGRFHHDLEGRAGAAFSAWLTIASDRLSGSSLEPNTFLRGDVDELDALLSGHICDTEIVFLKTYQGIDQEPVYCEGEITEQGRKIVGKWYYSWPDEQSGTFEMSREIVNSEMTKAQTQNVTPERGGEVTTDN